VGIVPLERALQLAADVDLDLVEVAPMARPPVCKLMDFGKFKYESALKAREARRNQQQTVIKEMKLRPKIDSHDYETKKGHVVRFLKAGDKVKVTIMFRGREQSRPELGFRLLRKLSEEVAELGFVEAAPKQDGRNMIMVLAPHRATKVAASDAKVASAEAKATASAEAKTAAAAAKATHREAVGHGDIGNGATPGNGDTGNGATPGNGGTPSPSAQTVNAAAAADRGAGEQ
jgi:translation initiation factor IF-3